MRILVEFRFDDEDYPAAVTGVEGDVSTILLPSVGDLVRHADAGTPFLGRVTDRIFDYQVSSGENIQGVVRIILSLNRIVVQ